MAPAIALGNNKFQAECRLSNSLEYTPHFESTPSIDTAGLVAEMLNASEHYCRREACTRVDAYWRGAAPRYLIVDDLYLHDGVAMTLQSGIQYDDALAPGRIGLSRAITRFRQRLGPIASLRYIEYRSENVPQRTR
jgi:hypothetical protein